MADDGPKRPEIAPWAHVLAVRDLERSVRYFRDVLGFRIRWEEASEWRLAERGQVRLMLGHCPDDLPAAAIGSHNWFAYLDVDDVDRLHAELAAKGAQCTAPADRPYGTREIVVTTIDGHRIVFGQTMAESPRSKGAG
jgi:catechol 2,3-dioxygenase-like lactoylglutathione lyase family enzyme